MTAVLCLAETQARLCRVLDAAGADPTDPALYELLCDTGAIAPPLAVRIYRNQVLGARVKALAAAYPACARILGPACFETLARDFAHKRPATQPDLNRYGVGFASRLDAWTARRDDLSEFRYLGDLARLEWCCHRLYYARDAARFDFAALARVPPQAYADIHWRVPGALGLLASNYPVAALRAANLAATAAAEVPAGELPEYLVITRGVETQVCVERVPRSLYRLLQACRQGRSFGQLAAGGAAVEGLVQQLPGLIARGWICGFECPRVVSKPGRRHV